MQSTFTFYYRGKFQQKSLTIPGSVMYFERALMLKSWRKFELQAEPGRNLWCKNSSSSEDGRGNVQRKQFDLNQWHNLVVGVKQSYCSLRKIQMGCNLTQTYCPNAATNSTLYALINCGNRCVDILYKSWNYCWTYWCSQRIEWFELEQQNAIIFYTYRL